MDFSDDAVGARALTAIAMEPSGRDAAVWAPSAGGDGVERVDDRAR